ncbi:hypothetical protein ACWT_6249 [Actinoplanes sp. SE50]|uniref:CAP domain-containing protein n=1 Tax=unclassified Actinoplanes TaxID=2626549 RepID=UPI00023ED125|nr:MULTISPECIES: CAP domain-containing protein [unclassified Actinoplanes]AEV87264.1 hypothetical protein ACPL_6382 [Actinoplanes sp. SE50/110]ATO85664.1 hypothetical protein ACWT_6249 [Actinoplanes sp. SE50]SLM03077.1 uncharacterized protein ACSP50_6366 [Actinoplanes sp. SE50/110]
MSLSAAARFRYTLVAGSTAVVIGSGFILMGLGGPDSAQADSRSADVPLAAATTATAAATASPGAAVEPSKATPGRTASASPATARTSATPRPKSSTIKVATGTTRSDSATVLDAVVAHINAARADEGLPPLTLDAQLSKASAKHNALMIDGCGLEHNCSGEAGIGTRYVGVQWHTAGENIGYASTRSEAETIATANGITDSMLAEVAPNDGHRRNLLNKDFTRIGLSVVRDGKGLVWVTQDFVG